MTPAEAREIAVAQNDRDHAAGLLPSRYVEDQAVLDRVARLLPAADTTGGERGRRRHDKRPRAAKRGA